MIKFYNKSWFFFYILYFILQLSIKSIAGTHITGTFHSNDFYKFIVKFGFQKTERHSQRDSFGYIYGNITSKNTFPVNLTLAVLDKYSFMEFYGNRTIANKELACKRMFNTLQKYAYDARCNRHAKGDYLRRVPCPMDGLCLDEDSAANVVPGHQFTYVISDLIKPRFWYVSMVSCYLNVTTCEWHYFDYKKYLNNQNLTSTSKQFHNNNNNHGGGGGEFEIDYDFQLVNGNPNQSTSNPLTFHFSFDQQNILEMNLIFFIVYLVLVPLQIYAVRIQKHPVTKLFTLSLILEFISLWFILSYMIRYAISGVGNETYKTTGDILDIFSRTSFMLILLLLAKGWAVTRQQICKTSWLILMSIWIPYCAFHVVLYVWNRTEVDIISDLDEYQTWPGMLVLVCRSTIMLWFLWELRTTMKYEHSTKKLDFLLHFGASSLVWFIYLPIVAIIALQVSPMWRYKLLLGITNSADCLAYCVMTGLLWPNRAGQYLLLAGTNYSGMDELEEFNEAPHIVHDGDVLINGDVLTNSTTAAATASNVVTGGGGIGLNGGDIIGLSETTVVVLPTSKTTTASSSSAVLQPLTTTITNCDNETPDITFLNNHNKINYNNNRIHRNIITNHNHHHHHNNNNINNSIITSDLLYDDNNIDGDGDDDEDDEEIVLNRSNDFLIKNNHLINTNNHQRNQQQLHIHLNNNNNNNHHNSIINRQNLNIQLGNINNNNNNHRRLSNNDGDGDDEDDDDDEEEVLEKNEAIDFISKTKNMNILT